MEKKLKGFTIIELLIVITIISVLCAIGVPAALTWVRDAKVRDANEEARIVYSAVQDYLTEMEIKNIQLEDPRGNITIMYSKSNVGTTLPSIDAALQNQNSSTYGGFNSGAWINGTVAGKLVDFSDALTEDFKGAWAARINTETYTVISAYWMPMPNGSCTLIDTGVADGFADASAQETYYSSNGILFGRYPI
ncbi:MAG: type II secretion system protein [Oscillospiraceae bacterium]|nr:type II secretion system protein [Oscillospiraceae bacterium]